MNFLNNSMNFQFTDNENDYQDIMDIERSIGKLDVFIRQPPVAALTSVELKKMKNVIAKFGPKLKTFSLWAGEGIVTALDACEILAMIPLVEKISFDCYDDEEYPNKKRRVRDQEELNLRHLKCLKLDGSDVKILEIFKRLPANVLDEVRRGNENSTRSSQEARKDQKVLFGHH